MNRALLAAAAMLSAAGAAHAQDFAVGAAIGTTGLTAEAHAALSPDIVLRGGYNHLKFGGVDGDYDGVDYEGELDAKMFGVFLDAHPFGNPFFVSAGAYLGDKTVALTSLPTAPVEIGNVTYTPAQVGILEATAEFNDFAPFAGLGWDTTFRGDRRWGWRVLAGAMFSGEGRVDLVSRGGAFSNDPALLAELAREEADLQDEIDDYQVYPVIQAGITFRF